MLNSPEDADSADPNLLEDVLSLEAVSEDPEDTPDDPSDPSPPRLLMKESNV